MTSPDFCSRLCSNIPESTSNCLLFCKAYEDFPLTINSTGDLIFDLVEGIPTLTNGLRSIANEGLKQLFLSVSFYVILIAGLASLGILVPLLLYGTIGFWEFLIGLIIITVFIFFIWWWFQVQIENIVNEVDKKLKSQIDTNTEEYKKKFVQPAIRDFLNSYGEDPPRICHSWITSEC